MTQQDTLLKKADVAKQLNVSISTVERLVARKKLRCVNLGYRTKRFRPADVARLESRAAGEARESWN